MSTILTVKNLSTSFVQGREKVDAVKKVSFELAKGEILAIVGESGSGKSVTAHSILRLLPDNAQHDSGSVGFSDQNLLALNEAEMQSVRGDRISMIFQEPMTALNPLHRVGKQIGEMLALHQNLSPSEVQENVLELLEKVQMSDPEIKINAYPHELSGGQRQRVMIAMAIANKPDILIADEPTTALDVTIQAQILSLMQDLQDELGMGIILITHDLGIVKNIAHRVAVMNQGEIVEMADTKTLFANPQHEYTRALLAAEPSGEPSSVGVDVEEIIRTKNLKIWFPVKKGLLQRTHSYIKAVNNASILVNSGETLGIVGESGSGKTTLALAILRLISSEGDIQFKRQTIQGLKQKELRPLRRQIQVVLQDPFASLSPRLSVGQIISEGLLVHSKSSPSEIENKVIQMLEEVGLDAQTRHRYPHEFSGGQRQRIAIARAIILEPTLVVLDEPTSALDRSVQNQVIDLLRKLQTSRNLSYLFISHDLKVIKSLSHKLIVMKEGDIVEAGDAREIFNNPQQAYTQRLLSASFM